MHSDDVFGFLCLAIGAVLVGGQFVLLWQASKEQAKGIAQQKATQAAEAATSAVARAADAVRAAESAVDAAQAVTTTEGLGNESINAIQTRTSAARTAADEAKQHVADANAKAKEAEAAQGSSITDVLAAIAGRSPLAVLGFLFAVLGAMSMGLVDVSFGAGAGG